jgi:hypothetical protein
VAQQNEIESTDAAPRSTPRRRARAPRRLGVHVSAAPLEATCRLSPRTFPRPTRALRRSKPATSHAPVWHPCRTTAGRAPHGPAVRPRLSSLVRRTTAGVRHLSSREQVSFLLKRHPLACEYQAGQLPLPLLAKLAPPLASRASQPPMTPP